MGLSAIQAIIWVWMGVLGYFLVRRVLPTDNPWLVLGSAVPTALVCLLGILFPLARLLGHPAGWYLGTGLLIVATGLFWLKGRPLRPLAKFGLSPIQWPCFGLLLLAANFVMHTREVIGPEDDYWVHFPLISLLNRGEFPPPNPFFTDLTLHGHFGRDYLVAILGWLSGGGEALISSLWNFNHILLTSAFFLAFGLGHRSGRVAGGFLMSCFLFFGISVGSRVGLVDTYDNNNLLVYCLLMVFVAIETSQTESRVPDIFLCFALGVYGIIYETHLLLFLITLWTGPLLWRRGQKPLHPKAWARPLVVSAASILLTAFLGGPIQDLALRATGLSQVSQDQAANYQSQRVQMAFPKQEFLQILVGPESYRRISYVYQGKAFESLRPSSKAGGMEARQDYHYAFIFGPTVLLMHWLALYLGLPSGLWLLRQKFSEGQVLWVFGLVSFLVPGLVNFGALHEKEYFRWEFAAGFGFAGALAAVMALLWQKKNPALKVLLVVLALLVTLGGERKVNRTIIDIQKMPAEQQFLALKPWYPSPRQWLLKSADLRLDQDLIDASLRLRELSHPTDRMFVDLDPRKHWDLFQESTVAGLAGLRSVGHLSTPPWMPDGITPFFRTPAWNTFWQTGDERVLPFLHSRWIFVSQPDRAAKLAQSETLEPVEQIGKVSLWRYNGSLEPIRDDAAEDITLIDIERPADRELRSEIALPAKITLSSTPSEAFDLGLRWVPKAGTDPNGPLESLQIRCQPKQNPYTHYLVAPLVQGEYQLQVTVNQKPISQKEIDITFDWSAEAEQAKVKQFDGRSLIFDPVSPYLVPPLKIGLRLFRTDVQRYNQPFGFEAVGLWSGEESVTLESVTEDFRFETGENLRSDLFLIDRSGREVPIQMESPQP